MKSALPVVLGLSLLLAVLAVESGAATQTMRLDYYHTGNASQEMCSVDRVVVEPLPWPGHPAKGIDETNRGKYLRVIDLYSGAG